MATIEQIDDLYRFAIELPPAERDALTVDEIYGRWRSLHEEDVKAIQIALDSYNRGERGRPVEKFLAEFRAERETLGDKMEPTE